MTGAIREFTGEYRFLSNFYLHPVKVNMPGTPWDAEWPSAEHLFQSMKTLDRDEVLSVWQAGTPGQAKRAGRRVTLREGWDEIKIPCMTQVLILKFGIGSGLAGRLLATGDRELLEGNTWGDTFWGVSDGVGQNHLGRLLMHRRELLRAVSEEHDHVAK